MLSRFWLASIATGNILKRLYGVNYSLGMSGWSWNPREELIMTSDLELEL